MANNINSFVVTQSALKANGHPLIYLGVMLIIVAYPFLTITYLFAPFTLFGKNIYIVIPALFFGISSGFILLAANTIILISRDLLLLIVLGASALLIWLSREVVYGENRSFFDFRYIFMAPLFGFVFANIVNDKSRRDMAAKLVFVTAVIQSLLGILHAHLFSYINIVSQEGESSYLETGLEKTREAGTLVSANAYGSVILCGLFLLVFYKRRVAYWNDSIFNYILLLFMLYGISLSGSRYPLAVGVILGVLFVYRNFRSVSISRFLSSSLIVVTLVGVLFYGGIELLSIFRFQEGSDGRLDKLLLPMELLGSGFYSFLIGASTVMASETHSVDGIGISDNSYLLVALQFGVPFAICWSIYIIKYYKDYLTSRAARVLFVYFLLTLGFYNSILWENWLIYFIFTFLCISQNAKEAGQDQHAKASARLMVVPSVRTS